MERPSWDEYFMKSAELAAERSTCCRLQVGCVIVKEKHIISTGYNGTPDGAEHCTEHWEDLVECNTEFEEYDTLDDLIKSNEFKDLHHKWSLNNEIHAEQNAIAFAARLGMSTKDSTLYVTHSPCINCAKLIAQTGILKVYYRNEYSADKEGINFLTKLGIECIKLGRV